TMDATYDAAGRQLSTSIRVPGGAGAPASWWKLGETAGLTAADSAGSKPGALAGAGAGGGNTAVFNCTPAGITTASPVLDTTQSYTVSFWAKTTANDSSWKTAVSADGIHRSAFLIILEPNGQNWEIHNYANDADNATDDTWAIAASPL